MSIAALKAKTRQKENLSSKEGEFSVTGNLNTKSSSTNISSNLQYKKNIYK